MHFPHPKFSNGKAVHRLVVLPDYQGIGIGNKFLNFCADILKNDNFRVLLTTSNLAMSKGLNKNEYWKLKRQGRVGMSSSNLMPKTSSHNRVTTSWEYYK